MGHFIFTETHEQLRAGLCQRCLQPEQVADRLVAPEWLANWLTQGDYSKRHLVADLIKGA